MQIGTGMSQKLVIDGLEMELWNSRPDGTTESLVLSWESFIDFLNEEFVRLDKVSLQARAVGAAQQDDPQE